MIYSPNGLMRYNDSDAIVDDIPLLSQWIKKSACFHKLILGGGGWIRPAAAGPGRGSDAPPARCAMPPCKRGDFAIAEKKICCSKLYVAIVDFYDKIQNKVI